MDKKNEVTKHRIIGWLEKNNIKYQEISDPEAIFNIQTKFNNQNIHLFLKKSTLSLIIGTKITVQEEEQKKLRDMDEAKRSDFFWDLKFSFANFAVGFEFEPEKYDKYFEAIFITKKLFFDGLTEEKFLESVNEVTRALMIGLWKLNKEVYGKTSGETPGSPTYNITTGDVDGSIIQVGTSDTTAFIDNSKTNELREIVKLLKEFLQDTSLNGEQKNRLEKEISSIEDETQSGKPKIQKIKECLTNSIEIIKGISDTAPLVLKIGIWLGSLI